MARLTHAALVFMIVFSFATQSFAQQQDGEETKSKFGPRRQLATIIFCGLGGAVLGLSTLSFYGRPQDKLSNIAVGFAIGVIGGTVYTLYGATTKSKDFYGQSVFPEESPAYASTRGARDSALSSTTSTPMLGYSYTF